MTELIISYKNEIPVNERIQITSAKKLHECFKTVWDFSTIDLLETFKVIYMNSTCHVLGHVNLSVGGIAGCIADPALVLATALKSCAKNIAIAHNHPSGSFKPSRVDYDLTLKIKQGAALFDIILIDHIILTRENYYSMAENGEI